MTKQELSEMMDETHKVREQYKNGQITAEGVFEYVSDLAYSSGVSSEMEELVAGLAFEAITGMLYISEDWA